MDTDNKQPDSETDELNSVLEIIREITEKSTDGKYIYRGEPKCHENISSSLYRECHSVIESVQRVSSNQGKELTIEDAQSALLYEASKFTHETDEIEILTQLQHYGGQTNLIDFTTDCLIALFFACDGRTDETGRVIILKKTEAIKKQIEQPRNPINRILSQKSIFVRPPKGFIEPDDVVEIRSSLKKEILQYLKKHHGISTETIYNDLHGFIRIKKIYQSAYDEFYKALAYQISSDLDKAISHHTKAIELKPDLVEAYNNRGAAYSNQSKYDEAMQDFNKAIELEPDFAEAYFNLGNVYLDQNKYDEAVRDYDKAIELKPDYADAYGNRGNACLGQGRHEEAIKNYDKVIELKPDDADVYLNRGTTYSRQGRHEEAIKDYDKVIELNPDDAGAYINRGNIYLRQGRHKEAIKNYEKAIELKPDYAPAYYNRGLAWLALTEWEKAKSDLTTAKNMGIDIIAAFRDQYRSIADFEQQFNVNFPKDIVAMLTPPPGQT